MPDVMSQHRPDPGTAIPTTPFAPADGPERVRPRLGDRISPEVALVLGVAWFVCYSIGSALEPRTSHPMPVIGVVLGVALLVGILTTAVGLVARRRWGLTASLASAGLFVAASVACPTTGHHHGFGMWWFGQMAVSLALVAASMVALRRT